MFAGAETTYSNLGPKNSRSSERRPGPTTMKSTEIQRQINATSWAGPPPDATNGWLHITASEYIEMAMVNAVPGLRLFFRCS